MTNAKRTRWAWLTATWFYIGRLKPGPGTWGSIAATLIWLACVYLWNAPNIEFSYVAAANTGSGIPKVFSIGLITLVAAIAALSIGIPASTIVARESHSTDPQYVVIDEVCGQWIALLFMPPNWKSALLCLALFRIFDIIKPPPVRQLERLHGGAGIMLDDVAAGFYALIVAQALQHWFHIAGSA